MKKLAIPILAMYALAGCAGIGMSKDLQKETARVIGEPVDTIDVDHIVQVAATIKWEAETNQGRYHCSADAMLQRTKCVKP